jgi:hypothetical protein
MKTVWILIIAIAAFAAGFLAGRKTIDTFQGVRLVKGELYHETVEIPVPEETTPEKPNLPLKFDTVYIARSVHDTILLHQPYYVTTKVDTAAIIAEYVTKRKYVMNILNQLDYGTLDLTATVQYNRLTNVSYDFTPTYKEVVIRKEKAFQVFSGLGYNTLGFFGLKAGVFYYDLGVEAEALTNWRQKGVGVSLLYKF